jgi:hypothetical protein
MQKKRKSGVITLLLAMAAAIALLFMGTGCPTSGDDVDDGEKPYVPSSTAAPEKPVLDRIQSGFELVNVDLKTVSETDANNVENQSASVAFTWTGQGATSYNVYRNDENSRPVEADATGLTSQVYFARNLEPETEYYFWIEAVNSNGTTLSDYFTRSTGKKGPNVDNAGGVERAHFAENLTLIPGNGSLTVSWNLPDRVAWFEVYYAPVGDIPHLDVYTPVEFRYDSSKELRPGAVDVSGGGDVSASIAYKGEGAEGHTHPVYPYLTPLAPGWEGYYVRDGASRVDGDTHPIWGIDDLKAKYGENVFYKIGEAYDKGIQDPYKPLDAAFAKAIPWTENGPGTPGTPVKYFKNSVTITGLENGKTYEVWVRPPNANGERAYSYITGTPGAVALQAPSGVAVSTPADTVRNLTVKWTPVSGADAYRIYASKYDFSLDLSSAYTPVEGGNTSSYTLNTLDSNTTYYVWVVAEKNGAAGAVGTPVSGKTGAAPGSGKVGGKIIAGTTDQEVKIGVYIEVNDHNPLNAGSYVLEDGTYLFDYVVLFAANIRNRNPNGTGTVTPYVHLNENVQHLLDNRNKYIKPLQDKGIKVVLGLLGDHDGVSFGTMTDDERTAFVNDVKKVLDTYQLDGIDFDDEWGSKEDWDNWADEYGSISPQSIWTYPTSSWSYPTSVTVYRNPSMGIEANNGQLKAPDDADMTRMWKESGENYYKTIVKAREVLGNDKIITLYEYNTGRYITAGGEANGTATTAGLENVIDYALQPWYNRNIPDSANGLSRSIYSPFGMDLGGQAYAAQNGAPNPPIAINGSEQASNTIYNYATLFKNAATGGNAYNVLYFYGLQQASNLLKYVSTDSRATVTKEEYISRVTEIIFGQKCILTTEGGDYRKDW